MLDKYPCRARNTLNGQVDFELVGYLLCARVDADGRGVHHSAGRRTSERTSAGTGGPPPERGISVPAGRLSRPWVLTMPYRLRYQMAWNHGLSRAVLRVYTRVLLGVYARGTRARGIDGGQTGMVTALQRAGGALNTNLHFHTHVLDGVFDGARPPGRPLRGRLAPRSRLRPCGPLAERPPAPGSGRPAPERSSPGPRAAKV